MNDTRKLTTKCPCCEATLVLDAATGEVLSHRIPKKPPAEGKDLEALFDDMERGKAQAEDLFEKEKDIF